MSRYNKAMREIAQHVVADVHGADFFKDSSNAVVDHLLMLMRGGQPHTATANLTIRPEYVFDRESGIVFRGYQFNRQASERPLVAILGLGSLATTLSGANSLAVMAAHIQDRPLITLDHVGHGGSRLLPGRTASLDEASAGMARAIRSMGHDEVDAMGICAGGLFTAKLWPLLDVKRLITIATPGIGGTTREHLLERGKRGLVGKLLQVSRGYATANATAQAVPITSRVAGRPDMFKLGRLPGTVQLARWALDTDLTDDIVRFPQNHLWLDVVGEHDELTNAQAHQWVGHARQKQGGHGHVVVVPGAGHTGSIERTAIARTIQAVVTDA